MKLKSVIILPMMMVLGFALASQAHAAAMSAQSLTLGDSRPNVSSTYTFAFTHTSAATLKSFSFDFCKVPSGTGNDCPSPVTTGNLTTVGTNPTSVSANLGTNTDWGITLSGKKITVYNNTTEVALTAGTSVTVGFSNITNTTLGEACDAAATDTCYVWVKSYDSGGSIIDTGVVTYTIVDAVQVTAKVDPTFTFVVSGVGASTVTNGVTTSVASTSTTLPFGSLQPGTPKYTAHYLYVTTNTVSGYSVTATMNTPLTGVVGTNNIDAYPAPWSAATAWTQPTGSTPNVDTGWFGGNTNDTDVPNWSGSMAGKFGGIDSTAVTVSKANASDNGATPTVVTYIVGVNVFQPSDYYTGTLVYNALPNY